MPQEYNHPTADLAESATLATIWPECGMRSCCLLRLLKTCAALRPIDRSAVREAIEQHLRFQPQRLSKSRIKRLRGMTRPQYRLRVGEIRVFYDVSEQAVEVLAIVAKPTRPPGLHKKEKPNEKSPAVGREG